MMCSHMHNIQENETLQLHEMSTFLDIEFNFAKQDVKILQDVRESWCERYDGVAFRTSTCTWSDKYMTVVQCHSASSI